AARPALCGQLAGKTAGRRSPPYVAAPAAGADGDPTSVAEEAIGCAGQHDMPARRAAATAKGIGRMSLNLLRRIPGPLDVRFVGIPPESTSSVFCYPSPVVWSVGSQRRRS